MKAKPTTPHQSSVYVLPNQPCIAGNCDTEAGESQNVSMGQNLDDIDTLLNEIDKELICRPEDRLPAAISPDDTVPVITKISLTELLSSAEQLLSKCCGKERQKQPSKIPIHVGLMDNGTTNLLKFYTCSRFAKYYQLNHILWSNHRHIITIIIRPLTSLKLTSF